ncbi:M20/M25/M40 family metallo-hydrolase [candidate division KSB1 bacterium]|nr:M20/M25/M40 family metallo-hydrolase [candidate division KSB1 bacterium]
MNKYFHLFIFLLIDVIPAGLSLLAQASVLQQLSASISADSIRQHLEILGHDSLQGRGTGTRGERMATQYIAGYLRRIKLQPMGDNRTYLQSIPMHGSFPQAQSNLQLFYKGQEHRFILKKDFLLYKSGAQTFIPQPVPLVFVGYGIIAPEFDYNDYQSIDVEGKVVVFLAGEPPSNDAKYFNGEAPTIYAFAESKQRLAISRGAIGSILIPAFPNQHFNWEKSVNDFAFEDVTLAYSASGNLCLLLNPEAAHKLFEGAPFDLEDILNWELSHTIQSFPLAGKISFKGEFRERDFLASNVIGLLKGINKRQYEKYIILSAHYDHLGIGPPVQGDSIYNGVVDNAAGVAAVLELARVFATMTIKPLHSILFLFLTGEEKGLLGSNYYLDHPVVPLYKTIANINVDGLAFFNMFDDVIGIGAEYSTLGEHLNRVAENLNLRMTPFPDECLAFESFTRSDQVSFAKGGIPSILISEGFCYRNRSRTEGLQLMFAWLQRVYHTPFDDLRQPLNFEAARLHCQVIFAFCHPLADGAFYPDWNSGTPFITARLRSIAEKR